MIHFKYITIAWLVCTCLSASAADHYPKNINIDILHYCFEITLSDSTDLVRGKASIDVLYKKAGIDTLRLDLVNKSNDIPGKGMLVLSIKEDSTSIRYIHTANELLVILPRASTKNETRKYTIQYEGIPATGLRIGKNKYGDRCFFTDNWPNKASNWLPVVDHPYDKATSEFIVIAPDHYQVISNGILKEESSLANHLKKTYWSQSVPIACWLYALGVADFAVRHEDDFHGLPIQTWVYWQDREAGFYDFKSPTPQVLQFYSDYIGPFAYEKLANVESNSVGGAMEAATCIFYGAKSVTGHRDEYWRTTLIHEIGHHWFGNCVTESDWDDVWLSEGFATYFSFMFIEQAYGREAFLKEMNEGSEKVFEYYEGHREERIVHDNITDMNAVTSVNTYQKGAWVLHMLRNKIGDAAFQKGIRAYYKKYYNGNASTKDFQHAMEAASGKSLDFFFKQWLYQGGNLKLSCNWKYNASNKSIHLDLEQIQKDGFTFKVPVEIGIYSENKTQPVIKTINLNGLTGSYDIPCNRMPKKIIIDPRTVLLAKATITNQ